MLFGLLKKHGFKFSGMTVSNFSNYRIIKIFDCVYCGKIAYSFLDLDKETKAKRSKGFCFGKRKDFEVFPDVVVMDTYVRKVANTNK